MTIQLKELPDGRIEMIQMRPETIGILSNRRIAERFANFLDQMEEHERAQLDAFTRDETDIAKPEAASGLKIATMTISPNWRGDVVPEQTEEIPPEDPHTETVAASGDESAPPAAQPEPEPAPEPVQALETETPMQEAFRRLEEGEALGIVADDIGISMPRLRGRWAARCKAMRDEAKPDAPAEVETVSCSTCGRDYRPGVSDEGLCARCTRDLGRA